MKIDRLDQLVLTVKDITVSCEFYSKHSGNGNRAIGDCRFALKYGNQKINLHQKGKEFEPKAQFRDRDGNFIESAIIYNHLTNHSEASF